MNVNEILSQLTQITVQYGPKLLGAIIVFLIGIRLIKVLTKSISKLMEKSQIDPTLKPFIRSIINALLQVLLVISVLSMVGIEMTSFIAILGAAGLAVGLALSGTLQNFAGGVVILLLKPFKVGDFIEAQGFMGVVKEIQIFNTILKTPDNKTIFVPNGGLSTNSVTNFSTEPFRRVDFSFGIGYGESVEKAKKVLSEIIAADTRIINEPAEPFIAVSELADSSVNFVVRVWAKTEDYWGVHFDMNEKVYNEFNKNNIEIPFPQVSVHMNK
ncbi:MAG: mechanosensitive ion channel [Paludibacter sp.]|nr:mechanosensitive ion channel [Paludibacter sp.]